MIRQIYILTGRAAYWLTAPILFMVSLWSKPRVRVLVMDHKGRILLVRNWYGRQRWALPGGGVKWREPPIQAARRELYEELSLDLPVSSLIAVGMLDRYDKTTPFAANLFAAEVSDELIVYRHPLELIDHRWVDPKHLPEPLHPSVKRALKLWRG